METLLFVMLGVSLVINLLLIIVCSRINTKNVILHKDNQILNGLLYRANVKASGLVEVLHKATQENK